MFVQGHDVARGLWVCGRIDGPKAVVGVTYTKLARLFDKGELASVIQPAGHVLFLPHLDFLFSCEAPMWQELGMLSLWLR